MKKIYKTRLLIAGIVLFLAILAIFGFYPIHFLNIQFSVLLARSIFDFSIVAIVLFLGIIAFTIIFGRLYCSTLCPFGILQEYINLIYDKFKSKESKEEVYVEQNPVKYYIAFITFALFLGGSAVLIRYIEPFTLFGEFFSFTKYGIILTALILVILFFKNRLFCTTICPVGTILGILSKISVFKIKISDDCDNCGICAKNCPSRCINQSEKFVDNENCIKCLKCISDCPKNAIKYGKDIKKPAFDINKRKALISAGFLAAFAGLYLSGVKFSKDLYSKVKDIILPPGAVDKNRMGNKCINCNLCIRSCPKKILVKADSQYSAVHIDYTKGEHYCDYDCKKCSEICPAGAIKKISLKEKQNTKIAAAVVNQHCIGCITCVSHCPKGAITMKNDTAYIDSAKCIGCGACKAVCPMSAIDIYSTDKQTVI